MTEDEIFEKRVEHWRYYHRSAPTSASHDVMLFLERLEGVTRERDEARADLARSVAAWEAAGMQGRTAHDALIVIAEERDEARAERDAAIARITEVSVMVATNGNLLAKDAYRRGAEAMREAAANALDMAGQGTLCNTRECEHWGRYVRALPIPEEP